MNSDFLKDYKFYLIVAFGVLGMLHLSFLAFTVGCLAIVLNTIMPSTKGDLEMSKHNKIQYTTIGVSILLLLTGHWFLMLLGVAYYFTYMDSFNSAVTKYKNKLKNKNIVENNVEND